MMRTSSNPFASLLLLLVAHLALVSCSVYQPQPPSTPPTKYTLLDGNPRASWTAALIRCAQQNATLATVTGAADRLQFQQTVGAAGLRDVWLGATNQEADASGWVWLRTGQPIADGDRQWAAEYPDADRCAVAVGADLRWESHACTRQHHIVCESLPLPTPCPQPQPRPNPSPTPSTTTCASTKITIEIE